jgi:hypothetical protein
MLTSDHLLRVGYLEVDEVEPGQLLHESNKRVGREDVAMHVDEFVARQHMATGLKGSNVRVSEILTNSSSPCMLATSIAASSGRVRLGSSFMSGIGSARV